MKTIFYNGTIITLEAPMYVESMVIEDDKIIYLGDFAKIKNIEGNYVDLQGKTLMPSFIDPHSHIAAFASTLLIADLSDAKSFTDIIKILKEYKNNNKIGDQEWIIGFGYDHNNLSEKKHPDNKLLDKVSMKNPISIAHKSGHMGVLNTKALNLLKITNSKNGYLEEQDFINCTKKTTKFSIDDMCKAFKKAENIYFSYGITTAQDGLTRINEFNLLKYLAENNELDIDVISYVDIKDNDFILKDNRQFYKYYNNYRIGGYKLILDGSPQGKTAWLLSPYENEQSYCGYPAYSDNEVISYIEQAINEQQQLLIHCNGDAACEQMIRCYEKVNAKCNYLPVMIHAQMVNKNQLERMKKIGIIPSFFVAHTYYWGDIHIKNLGNRAYKISPVKTACDLNLKCTLHQDTPVILPNMFETIWCAVNRITKNGTILKGEEVPVLDAIKSLTINAANQYNESEYKGSLKEGKNADFIIISDNPLELDKNNLKNIIVLETVKNGKSVYKK